MAMAMKASSETIRELESDVIAVSRRLDQISTSIFQSTRAIEGWDDEKAAQLAQVMSRVASLTAQPVERLQSSAQRIEQLATIIDDYGHISIGV